MTESSIQQQAKALGDPTRNRIFRYVADADDAVDVGELTRHLGLNHNAIRQHLTKLIDAGLVVRSTAPARGRGRPRLIFGVHPTVDERWGVGGPHQRLSLLLLEMLRTGDNAVEVGRRAGRMTHLGAPGERAIERVEKAMARFGFDPSLVTEGELSEFVLRNCPFAEAAAADPRTVCAIHLGLAEGMADQLDGVAVEDLEPHDPVRAGCRLRIRTGVVGPTSADTR
jgi:predicted ArsR family transcriptional regulator